MNTVHKRIAAAGALSILALSGIAGATAIRAAAPATSGQSRLIDSLAAKFNLSRSDVQAVFDQQHSDRKGGMQSGLKSRLDSLVMEGKLTANQETKILAKLSEEPAFRAGLSGKSGTERRAALTAHRSELTKWAADNGIDLKVLSGGAFGRGMHRIGAEARGQR